MAALNSQKDSLKVLADMLEMNRKLTDSASTKASSADSNKNYEPSANGDSSSEAGHITKSNVVTSFDSHCLNEDKTANHFAPMMTAANNFINQTTNVLPGLNRCDDLFDHSHENSEPIPVSNFDGPAFPQLRKVMTTVADSTQLEILSIDSPRSAVELTL